MEAYLDRLKKEKEDIQSKIDKITARIEIETDEASAYMLKEQKDILFAYLDIVNKRLEYHTK